MGDGQLLVRAAIVAARYNAKRALRVRPRSLAEVAERSWVIAPGIDEPSARVFIPAGHLERILGGPPHLPNAHDVRSALCAQRHVARETRAYQLRDAWLIDRNIYSGMHKHDLFRGAGPASLMRERAGVLDEAMLASCYSGARWFGHLLHDEFPLQLLAETLGSAVRHARPAYRHEPAWRSLLGLDRLPAYGVLHARQLIIVDDVGQNPEKRARYQALRARLAHLPRGEERVYLRRGTADGELRAMLNAEAVEARLAREGFHVVDTAGSTPEQIVRKCAGASIVVSVDGSHAAPAYLLARDGGCAMFIAPPQRVDGLMVKLSGFFGMLGAMFVGHPTAQSDGSFSVDPDELMRAIDAALTSAKGAPAIARANAG